MQEPQIAIDELCAEKQLDERYRNHTLAGSYASFRECHIYPVWLLMHAANGNKLIPTSSRTGTCAPSPSRH